jgi:nucleotide-binding universal stress UspA family protein
LLRVVEDVRQYGMYLPQYPFSLRQEFEARMKAEATSYLDGTTQRGELVGITTKTKALSGMVVSTILAVAQSQAIDLIVLCSRGRRGIKRWVFGSVAQEVARSSPVPVLIVHEDEAPLADAASACPRPLHALVALDSSAFARTVLVPTAHIVSALAAPAQGVFHLVYVAQPGTSRSHAVQLSGREGQQQGEACVNDHLLQMREYLRAVKDQLCAGPAAALQLSVTCSVVVHEDIAEALIRFAEQGEEVADEEGFGGCDLIAMATHGRGGWQRLVKGSITQRVLGASRLPLFIVRPREIEAQEHRLGEETRPRWLSQLGV